MIVKRPTCQQLRRLEAIQQIGAPVARDLHEGHADDGRLVEAVRDVVQLEEDVPGGLLVDGRHREGLAFNSMTTYLQDKKNEI